jgi:hypothetical protein
MDESEIGKMDRSVANLEEGEEVCSPHAGFQAAALRRRTTTRLDGDGPTDPSQLPLASRVV